MSDTFGLLQVPLGAPPAGSAAGDPLLDALLAYLQAVINAKTKLAWKSVCAYKTPPTSEPLPVSFVFPHSPTNESFSIGKLPALFAWRATDHTPKTTRTQDWLIRESMIAVLWVPPRATQEQARVREPFKNAVSAAIDWAIIRGRDPSWVVAGDTYYGAATYGSVFSRQAGLMTCRVRQIEPHPIVIPFDDGPSESYDALLAQIDVQEVLAWGADAFPALDHLELDTTTNGLALVTAILEVQLASISPGNGPAAGGTIITLSGAQFESIVPDPSQPLVVQTPAVTINGVACTGVVLVDETTLTATTPELPAGGPYDVVVTNPSGASVKLPAAFTAV